MPPVRAVGTANIIISASAKEEYVIYRTMNIMTTTMGSMIWRVLFARTWCSY